MAIKHTANRRALVPLICQRVRDEFGNDAELSLELYRDPEIAQPSSSEQGLREAELRTAIRRAAFCHARNYSRDWLKPQTNGLAHSRTASTDAI